MLLPLLFSSCLLPHRIGVAAGTSGDFGMQRNDKWTVGRVEFNTVTAYAEWDLRPQPVKVVR